ncbi:MULTISPECIES: HNH endonuclease family protein [Gordonia]|uniref:HNH endonuclease family protein n=1 Tax=Gordonia amicalis TaxID=89053 RepID=A0AAE4U8Z3_9ACTN|nr:MULTISPECIES: HNH endonuclease family protein [Gordonia]MCZ4579229.1 HNH endonuclease family protein [Gordonia amicalis]MDJ0452396.1 HNH endonuclease family protein [Gordonia amicalis]MDV6306408.1 HNH endonuclease family protein [Gordonia amicalis]MDV6311838.1 HNH endonuclease family protein [Gordonia amicalis]MDV7075008.1 HNH endonuclease family protein [Gordonia amicalis]
MVLRDATFRSPTLRRLRMRVRWIAWKSSASGSWSARQWSLLVFAVVTAIVVAVGSGGFGPQSDIDSRVRTLAREALARLASIPVHAQRPDRDDYDRSAFGAAWTDAVAVAGGGNGCDTRNDILARDLQDIRAGPVSSCPRAVLAGEFRSPYSGEFVVFRRDRNASSVQIDHIVPLAYAWDMGAWSWELGRRLSFANDPANLVAVDGPSNQDKSDSEPGRWMPPVRGFWCQYAIQFVMVSATYGLTVDAESREVLTDALRCGQ